MKQTRYLLLLLAVMMLPQLQTAMCAAVVGEVNMDGFTFRLYKETNHNYALLLKPADSYTGGDLTLSSYKVTYNSTTYIIEGVFSDAFKNKTDLGIIDLRKATSLTYVGSSAFSTTTFSYNGTVLLPSSCTELKSSAFSGSNISSIDLSNITTLGQGCFSNTTELETLSLPKVTALPGSAFSDSNIKSLNAPLATSVGTYCFLRAKQLRSFDFPQLVTIESQAFSYSGLCQIVLPATVTSIGFAAFSNCPELHTVVSKISNPFDAATNMFQPADDCTLVVPSSATSKYNDKGWAAFFNKVSSSMTDCILSDGELLYRVMQSYSNNLAIAGQSAFSENSIVQKTFSPTEGSDSFTFNGVTYVCAGIDSNAFKNNTKLEWLSINPGGTSFTVLTNAFTGSAVKVIQFCPDSQYDCPITLFSNAFYNSKELRMVYGSQSGIDVGMEAFIGCDKLSTVENLKNVGLRAFYNTNLENVSFTNNTTRLERDAFSGTKINSVVLPASLQTMDSPVFANCYNLVDVTANMTNPFELSSEEFAEMAKWESDQSVLRIPNGTWQKYVNKKWIERFAIDVSVENGLKDLEIHDNEVYYLVTQDNAGSDGRCVISRQLNSNITDINITKMYLRRGGKRYYITGIADRAFKNSNLKSFKITDVFTSYFYVIGNEAFAGSTQLEEAYFGTKNYITNIGEKAFKGCSSLKYFVLPPMVNGNGIGNYAFAGLTGLKRFQVEFDEPIVLSENWREVFQGTPIEEIPLYVPKYNVYYTIRTSPGHELWNNFLNMTFTSFGKTISDDTFKYTVLEGDAGYDKKCLGITGRADGNNQSRLTLPKGSYEVDGVEYPVCVINKEAFMDDDNIETIDLSKAERVIEVWDKAFYNCGNLTNVIYNEAKGLHLTAGHSHVYYTNEEKNSYYVTDGSQFYQSALSEVTLTHNVADYAFYNCPNLKTVRFANTADGTTCTSLGAFAFGKCPITTLTLPSTTDHFSIGEKAFLCSGLTTLVIPDYTTFTVEAEAFLDTEHMKKIKSHISNPADLDANAFSGIGTDCVLWIPDNDSYFKYRPLAGWRYFFDNNKFQRMDNIPTGVDKVDEEGAVKVYYNLQGQRVMHPQHGSIYVVNGRKVRY